MRRFDVFDARDPTGRAEWLALFARWPGREVMAHPSYVALFAGQHDAPMCAALSTDRGGILFPFVARRVAAECWADPSEPSLDLTSPYGYGGPYGFAVGAEDVGAFWSSFDDWAGSMHAVTAFVRMSLFEDQRIGFPGETEARAMNIVRTLDVDSERLWREYDHKVRKNVERARRSGLAVERDETGARLQDFLAIYHGTMQRRSAADTYYFNATFFETIVRELEGHATFFHALDGTRVVSSELVLVSADYVYSFLGGTIEDAFPMRPNDLLKHAVIEWGIGARKKAYVLGGGYAADDGIFRYKKAFAPSGETVFSIGKRVYDAAAAERLLEQRRRFEGARGSSWAPSEGYFPPYRAP